MFLIYIFRSNLAEGSTRRMLFSPDVTRILTVRHPFLRLLSAYSDKYQNGKPVNSYKSSELYK